MLLFFSCPLWQERRCSSFTPWLIPSSSAGKCGHCGPSRRGRVRRHGDKPSLVNFFCGPVLRRVHHHLPSALGRGRVVRVKAVHTAILLAVVIGAVMTFAGIFGANWLLGLMNTP